MRAPRRWRIPLSKIAKPRPRNVGSDVIAAMLGKEESAEAPAPIKKCAECDRLRPVRIRGMCSTCYAKSRQAVGICSHCREKRPLYARGECKPCRDAYYRGFR